MDILKQEDLWSIAAVNTHCHHLCGEMFSDITLHKLLQMTYVSWILPDQGDTVEGHTEYFLHMGANSYFRWWKASIEHLYGDGRALTPQTWEWYDERIKESYLIERHDIKLLQDACKYTDILIDDYKKPGDSHNLPNLMRPVFRCDMFLCGFNIGETDENLNHAYDYFDTQPQTLAQYVQATEYAVRRAKENGVVGIKIAIAYERSLRFKQRTEKQASIAFANKNATQEQRIAFSDYMMFELAKIAAKLSLPIQIHTGLGAMKESRAIYLRDLISANPQTKFDLFHASYPWCDDVLGLAHCYQNVYLDLCWVPLISTARATAFLKEAIELVDADRLMWGCDTWTSEESYGARMAVHTCIIKVLNELICEGIINIQQAKHYAQNILHNNAQRLYNL